MKPRLIVHGGAWSIPDEQDEAHIKGVTEAISHVFPLLEKGLSAVDAVEKAVRILEEDPTFDAGRGAVLNSEGEIEMDASIMDGRTLAFGAVAALQNILHPISVARCVMTETEHCFIVGNGAQKFAKEHNFVELDPEELLTERELEVYKRIKREKEYSTRIPFEPTPKGTVGAVAMDRKGNLAAATSTGGTSKKLPGRVGDTPIIGAGTYADNEIGAASATGWGEAIMKSLLTKTACDLLRMYPIFEVTTRALNYMHQRVGEYAGLIMIDRHGKYSLAHITKKMAYAYFNDSEGIVAGIDFNQIIPRGSASGFPISPSPFRRGLG